MVPSMIWNSYMWRFVIVNWILMHVTVVWIKQAIWKWHLGLWETVMDIFHYCLTFYSQNNKSMDIKWMASNSLIEWLSHLSSKMFPVSETCGFDGFLCFSLISLGFIMLFRCGKPFEDVTLNFKKAWGIFFTAFWHNWRWLLVVALCFVSHGQLHLQSSQCCWCQHLQLTLTDWTETKRKKVSHRGSFSSSVSAPPHMLTPEHGMRDVVNTAGWPACACFFHKQHKHGPNGRNDTNNAEGPAFPSCAGAKTHI